MMLPSIRTATVSPDGSITFEGSRFRFTPTWKGGQWDDAPTLTRPGQTLQVVPMAWKATIEVFIPPLFPSWWARLWGAKVRRPRQETWIRDLNPKEDQT